MTGPGPEKKGDISWWKVKSESYSFSKYVIECVPHCYPKFVIRFHWGATNLKPSQYPLVGGGCWIHSSIFWDEKCTLAVLLEECVSVTVDVWVQQLLIFSPDIFICYLGLEPKGLYWTSQHALHSPFLSYYRSARVRKMWGGRRQSTVFRDEREMTYKLFIASLNPPNVWQGSTTLFSSLAGLSGNLEQTLLSFFTTTKPEFDILLTQNMCCTIVLSLFCLFRFCIWLEGLTLSHTGLPHW